MILLKLEKFVYYLYLITLLYINKNYIFNMAQYGKTTYWDERYTK